MNYHWNISQLPILRTNNYNNPCCQYQVTPHLSGIGKGDMDLETLGKEHVPGLLDLPYTEKLNMTHLVSNQSEPVI